MEVFEVTGQYVTFHPGARLGLSPEQAEIREHHLKKIKKLDDEITLYEVVADTGFRRGEVIGYDGPELHTATLASLNGGPPATEATPPGEQPREADEADTDEIDETEELAPVTEGDLTVSEIASDLSMTIGDTIKLLADYEVHAKKGSDVVPAAKVKELYEEQTNSSEDGETE